MRYNVIAESGFAFRPDAEVQGLTLEAVGSGTTIEYLQVFGSEDDGVELFGGSVAMRWVVVNDVDDDSLDFDDGNTSVIRNAIIVQGVANGDNGIEADNAGPSDDAEPKTTPVIANLLVIGNTGKDNTAGYRPKDGFGGTLEHAVFVDGAFVE